MAVTRLHRTLRLITMMQGARARAPEELARELGVSRRTLFRDLTALKEAGIPYYHEKGVGYRISRSFFLPPINLTVIETLGLLLLGRAAAAQRNPPLMGPALSAISKLMVTVPEPLRQACADLMSRVSIDLPAQAHSDQESDHFAVLQRCVDERRYCRIRYGSPVEREPMTCRLAPYVLHFAGRAWYVVGRSDEHREVRMFKLARIRSIEAMARRFPPLKRWTLAKKIGKAWQLIAEGEVHAIELEFSPMVATNVSEVRWHDSQESRMLSDGRCVMTFEVDGLGEIAWWICGYADQVKVRKPKALADRVRRMLAAAAGQYAGD